MEQKLSFGQKIDFLRKKKKWSSRELGRTVDVSGQAIIDIINGVTKQPKIPLIVKLASILEVDLNWLLENEDPHLLNMVKAYKESEESINEPLQGANNFESVEKLKSIIENLQDRLKSKDTQIKLLEDQIEVLKDYCEALKNR